MEMWKRSVTAKYPHRDVKMTVVDMTGKLVLTLRFIRPLKPPEVLLTQSSTALTTTVCTNT